MLKLIENIFFTETIAQKSSLPDSYMNPADIYNLKESGNDTDGDCGEVKTSIDESNRSPLNFMQGFVKEKNG